ALAGRARKLQPRSADEVWLLDEPITNAFADGTDRSGRGQRHGGDQRGDCEQVLPPPMPLGDLPGHSHQQGGAPRVLLPLPPACDAPSKATLGAAMSATTSSTCPRRRSQVDSRATRVQHRALDPDAAGAAELARTYENVLRQT